MCRGYMCMMMGEWRWSGKSENLEILLFENTLRKQVKHDKIKQTMRRERW